MSAGASPIVCEAALLAQVEAHFSRYVVTHPRHFLVVALWSIGTHLFDSFDAFTYLAITSPAPRCGKTRLAELMDMICARSRRTVGATAPVLFRTIERDRPTLIIDEAEVLSTNDERAGVLREVLNAGYRVGQTVSRCDERLGNDPRTFKTYCPKAIVLIGSLKGALADRCIEIRMQRKAKERVERFRFPQVAKEAALLKQRIEIWAKERAPDVASWYQTNGLRFIEDREEELWLPLFAVCVVLAPERVAELQRVVEEMAGAKAGAESGDWGVSLLSDIRTLFTENGTDRLSTEYLRALLTANPEAPWGTWNRGEGPRSQDIARYLKPFGIHSQNIRLNDKVVKGYLRESFADAWERYLPKDAGNAATPLQDA